ncbi:proteasome assembly chaperone 4 isoform X1 [Phalacrocorax aristotelis]|uniref:proteasome assembly chaperone 4 isoform X1 n=1 Tax=Phalacrocorax aristotelis TaxID=126867 RepID=UPI003F4B030D
MEAAAGGIALHDFSGRLGEQRVHFHAMRLRDSLFLWVGAAPALASLAVAMCSPRDSIPVAASLLGDPSDTASACLAQRLVARKSHLRKAFPGDGCGGDGAEGLMVWQTGTPAETPLLPQDKAEQGKHLRVSFLPCCITWYPTPPYKICLAKTFQLCESIWKKIMITEVFIFLGKGAKLELPRQEVSLCFIIVTEAEGQTNFRSRGSPHWRRSVLTTWFQAKTPKSSKSSEFHNFLKNKLLHVPVT